MAIIQISKIQVRSGNLVDLPQLDEAELGWASDNKRLFIGKTTPNENIEILTSYSNIDFSQLTGSYGNLNISNPVTGQVLVYDQSSNAWLNAGGNASDPGEPSYWSSNPIHLGNVSTLKIGGGAIGYVLETDGTGNLSWTPKGVISANISAATKANPVVITTSADNFFTDADLVTITNVSGMTQLNGNSYYANVLTSNTFSLYSDSALTVPVNGTGYGTYTGNGRVVASVGGSGGGGGGAGGTTYSVQYNYAGVPTGDASFTWNNTTSTLTVTGTSNVTGNLNVTSNVTASRLISNVATGTAPLVVTSTTQVANLSVATAGSATTAGTVTTNAQPNITSVGTLSTLSVSGNANIGNIGTGILTASGNIQGANLVTGGVLSVTGNANIGNIGTATAIITTGNITTINSGLLQNGNSNVTITANGNVTYYITGNATARMTYTSTGANLNGTLSVSGNANVGNIGTAQVLASANITAPQLISNVATGTAPLVVTSTTQVANLSVATAGSAGSATTAGTVTTNAQPNITSVGTLTSLSVSGNVTGGNLITTGIGNIAAIYVGLANKSANLNVFAANASTAGYRSVPATYTDTAGSYAVVSQAAVHTFMSANVTSLVGITYSNLSTVYIQGAPANSSPLFAPNRFALYVASDNSYFGGNIITTGITTGANTTAGSITGNWTLTAGSQLQATYADLAEYYEADQSYEPGTVLMFGGEKEVTVAEDGTTRVAGVVSTDPAYLMNANCPGHKVAIALQGRVPVKVRGRIRKGDLMVSAGNGFARPWNNASIGMIIGKSIQDFDEVEGIIEIAVGRL